MRCQFLVIFTIIQGSTNLMMWSESFWMKQNWNVDYSHFVFWKEFRAVSIIGCLLGCHHAFSRGCGYKREENRCHLYMDWSDTPNWIQEDGMDYYVSTSEWIDLRRYGVSSSLLIVTQSKTWLDARSYCETLAGHLYIMDTAQKRQALMDHFEVKGVTLGNNYWLGLSDRETEGNWSWVDGRKVHMTPSLWEDYQPNNQGGDQNCGRLKPKKDFKLNDKKCSLILDFMCEVPLAV